MEKDNENGIQEKRIRVEGAIWRVIMVYNGENMKMTRKRIEERVRG